MSRSETDDTGVQQSAGNFCWVLRGLWKEREEGRQTIAGQSISCPVVFAWYVLCLVIKRKVSLQKEETPEEVFMSGSLAVLAERTETAAVLSQRNSIFFLDQAWPHNAALATIGRSSLAAMLTWAQDCGHFS